MTSTKTRKSVSAWNPSLAAPFVAKHEGLNLEAYKCPAGEWTIGYGNTRINGREVRAGDRITKAEAEAMLKAECARVRSQIADSVHVPVSLGEFTALVDFVYNVGIGSFRRSTLLKKLNAARYVDAGYEFLKWKYAAGKELPGLVIRREDEKAIFLNG